MSRKAHGQIRLSQVITTWGPGSLLDLPRYAVIVSGLESWPNLSRLNEIVEPRLTRKLSYMTQVNSPGLFMPPAAPNHPQEGLNAIDVWRFPEWFVVQEKSGGENKRSRRLVPFRALDDRSLFDGRPVVPTRFVRACTKGHIDDLNWRWFVHGSGNQCRQQLWLDERGMSGDLAGLVVRCECGESRSLHEAMQREMNPLGTCRGARPWLGRNANESCGEQSRLLIRTASNAYFPQIVSTLSIPDQVSKAQIAVVELWDDLQIVDDLNDLTLMKKKPKINEMLIPFTDEEILETIKRTRDGDVDEKPVKPAELDALLAAPEGYGDDIPVNPNFHARRLPDGVWRTTQLSKPIESVTQLHRLREVLALIGFTRFEAVSPDINGEYNSDVERAALALDPSWFPAVENRGEGLFLKLSTELINEWLALPAVKTRLDLLETGHKLWVDNRKRERPFPGGPYILLHTLSHLLIQSLAMRCGYPASSIRERIYSDVEEARYGLLLFTGSPDAEGTLGGLVQQAKDIEIHLNQAIRMGVLCSNDPVCANHEPGMSIEGRWLHGAACHGCLLLAETSCEMHNEYLDRALVVPTLATTDTALFGLTE